jgi:hypothetical protein
MVLVFAAPVHLTGCGDGSAPAERAAVDSTLVTVMADLYLADARSQLLNDPNQGDSLRDLVYEMHGLDSLRLEQRLGDLVQRPGAVAALTDAVETRLSNEQRGSFSP